MQEEEIDLVLQKLIIDKYQITRAEAMEFLGVSLNENLTWKKHFKYLKKNTTKNIGLSFKATPFLNKKSLLAHYISNIRSYINYQNTARGSTFITSQKDINSQLKISMPVLNDKSDF